MGKQWKQCQTLFFWAPKSLQMVTAAMKLEYTYSLEGKLYGRPFVRVDSTFDIDPESKEVMEKVSELSFSENNGL